MPLLSWNRGYQKKGVPLGLPTSHAAFPWIKGTYIYAPVCLVHHGCVGVFREVGNGFVNCTSCLTLWVHWRIFFFLVTRPAFCGRLVQRNFAGAPQWDNPFLLHASGVWGEVRWVRCLRWGRSCTLTFFQDMLFSEIFEGYEGKLHFYSNKFKDNV